MTERERERERVTHACAAFPIIGRLAFLRPAQPSIGQSSRPTNKDTLEEVQPAVQYVALCLNIFCPRCRRSGPVLVGWLVWQPRAPSPPCGPILNLVSRTTAFWRFAPLPLVSGAMVSRAQAGDLTLFGGASCDPTLRGISATLRSTSVSMGMVLGF